MSKDAKSQTPSTKWVAADRVKVDFRSTHKREPDPNDEVRDALSKAKETIDATVYKLDSSGVLKELKRAARRGVEIRMIVNADTLNTYERLKAVSLARRKSVHIKTWPTKRKQKLHMKLLIVDRNRVVTGSFNWNDAASGSNAELLIRFRGSEIGQRFSDIFDELWVHKGVKPL